MEYKSNLNEIIYEAVNEEYVSGAKLRRRGESTGSSEC